MKGGGDAVSAARAVLQTGEYDYAWNLQVEDDILKRLEQGGKGRVEIWAGRQPRAHPAQHHRPVDRGRRRARRSVKTTHPLLTDPAVRQALNLLVDRSAVQEQIYGRQGQTSANFLNAPVALPLAEHAVGVQRRQGQRSCWTRAGWKRGADGIRAKDGKRLKLLFQTSINAPRQKTQAIVKQAAAKAGIEMELKSVVASVFFSSDAANPDTYPHFYADLQMYTTHHGRARPAAVHDRSSSRRRRPARRTSGPGRNITRWRNEEYDRAWRAAETEMDPVKRAALFIKMNDLVIQNVVVIPVLWRNGVSESATAQLRGMDLSGWDSTFWRLPHWYKA